MQLFVTLWTVAHQAPLSMWFSMQKYWSELPIPFSGDLPDPGIEPKSPALAGGFFTAEPSGKPLFYVVVQFSQHCLLKRRSFLRCVFLPSLSRLIGRKSRGCFWTVCPVPLMWVSVFVPVLYCFDYCSFGVYSEFGEHDSFTPVLLQDCFG